MSHTKEPWYASDEDGNWRVMAADENGGYTLADMCSDDQEANGRRIVACVNACEGISTESLERGVSDWSIFMRELKAQRDELLVAAKELVLLAELGDADEDLQNWHPALESARAAIAKAEAV